MNPTLRSSRRSAAGLLAAALLVITAVPITRGQSPSTPPQVPPGELIASVGSVSWGGSVGTEETRDPEGQGEIRFGTTINELRLIGERDAFAPGESAGFRLELPGPSGATSLLAQLYAVGEGVESILGSGQWLVDPSWDTMTGTLPAPAAGNYTLRVFRDATPVAAASLRVRDVPRLDPPLTDRTGLLADSVALVDAAALRFEQATGGWTWYLVIDTTGGAPIHDYAADVWAVNDDQLLDSDALAVMATSDANVAIVVGEDLAFTVTSGELAALEDAVQDLLIEQRWEDAVDVVADDLVTAHQTPPPDPDATPTPRPTATPRPTPTPTPTPPPATVVVPDLVGLTRRDAEEQAARADLELRVTFRQTSDEPEGTVLSQAPRPGREVPAGTTVTVVVATEPAAVAIPNVSGLTEADAFAVLLDAGLQPGERTRRYSDTVPSGRVIRTDPRAGTVVQRGTTVDYLLSRGPEPTPTPSPTPPGVVTVPDVRNETEVDAVSELLDAGLQPGERFERYHGTVPAGRVIRTDPAAGTRVARNTAIDYYLSRGPEPATSAPVEPTPRPTARPSPSIVTVPDVRNQTEDEAIATLQRAGLVVGERFRRYSNQVPVDRVIRTDPAAGVQVARGTTVNYYLSRGPQPPPTPTPRPTAFPPTTPRPTGSPSTGADLLARIRAAGVIRVNIDPHQGPWSVERSDGTFDGFDVRVAREIAERLGVDTVFTTYPQQEVAVGSWNGRWDVAMGRLAITAPRRATLAFTGPYAYDPAQLVATNASGITTVDGLAGAEICVASLSDELAWLTGTLDVTELPGAPAAPPAGVVPVEVPLDQRCQSQITDGSAAFAGWATSLVTASNAISNGVPATLVGDPAFYRPIGIAADGSLDDTATLIAALDGIIGELRDDGTLSTLSRNRFGGLDLTGTGATPAPVVAGAEAAPGATGFTSDPQLVSQVPADVQGEPLVWVALSGADLESLLVPANRDIQRAMPRLRDLLASAGSDPSRLGLVIGSVVSSAGEGSLTAARLPGTAAGDLAAAMTPLLTNQYADRVTADVTVAGRQATRISDGPFTPGDVATYLYLAGDVVWSVVAAPPLVGQIFRALP
jgi:beta-lactam-binding protein with PASTA domain/ABC-type amino acid transport substrate-binding protein